MLAFLKSSLFTAAVAIMTFSMASDVSAQFGGRGFRLPGGTSARGLAQRILGQQNYRQPTYEQPRCNQPTYPQPVYNPPVYNPPVYTQPAPVVEPKPAPVPAPKPTPMQVARQNTADAKTLFQQGRYPDAVAKLDAVVKIVPKDSNAYQFRALSNFAANNFDAAAADAYDAISLGNTWTRPVVESIYGQQNFNRFDQQLNLLSQVSQQSPSMQSHFLLAYFHLVNGQWQDGKVQLQKVLAISPKEPLSTKLLAAVDAKLAADQQTAAK